MHYAVIRTMEKKSSLPTILGRATLLAVALFLLFAAFAVAHHFHTDLTVRSSCSICKSAHDLFSADQQADIRPSVPILVALPVFPDHQISREEVPLSITVSRAPPLA